MHQNFTLSFGGVHHLSCLCYISSTVLYSAATRAVQLSTVLVTNITLPRQLLCRRLVWSF